MPSGDETRATIATVEPWDRRPREAHAVAELAPEECWKREVVQRWAHAMAVAPYRADVLDKPKQQTQPRGKDSSGRPAKPIEIPVPKREDFDKLIKRAAKPRK